MALEIEHKFLVRDESWRDAVQNRELLRQGYLANTRRCSVRVRMAGEFGWLSVKAMTPGIARAEYEVAIPPEDANAMLDSLCEGPLIEKWRHELSYAGHWWEIDEFLGANAGLVVAEIELPGMNTPFERPAWLGEEVTHDVRYYNFKLAVNPWSTWGRP
ncbi:MAG TPA: CYTH domain-containing protein [Steroidobacteraceae bacterium]|nr:CYTH domain-containing protein [Steroidobacteraceae bacterium]